MSGRVSKGLVLQCCKNTSGSHNEGSNVGNYKALSTQVSFVGGLAEVNAGKIEYFGYDAVSTEKFYFNDTAMPSGVFFIGNEYGGVGGIVGLNGTRTTDGIKTGVIENCAAIYQTRGKNVGGIAAAAGGSSAIKDCVSHGDIVVAKNASATGEAGSAGILYEVSQYVPAGKTITLTDNLSTALHVVEKSASGAKTTGIVYNTRGKADILRCRNYTPNMTYGITSSETDRRAKTIKYCVDASNSTNKDKDTAFGLTTGDPDSMVANLYIGEKGGKTELFAASRLYADSLKAADGSDITDTATEKVAAYTESTTGSGIEAQIGSTTGWSGDINDGTGILGVEIQTLDESGETAGAYADVDAVTIKWTKGAVADTYQNQVILYDSEGKRMALGPGTTTVSATDNVDQTIDIEACWTNRATNNAWVESGFDHDKIQKIVILICGSTDGSTTIGISGLSWKTAGATVSQSMILNPQSDADDIDDAVDIAETRPLSKLYFEAASSTSPHLYLYGVPTQMSGIDINQGVPADKQISLVNSGDPQYFTDSYLNNSEVFRTSKCYLSDAVVHEPNNKRVDTHLFRYHFYKQIDGKFPKEY